MNQDSQGNSLDLIVQDSGLELNEGEQIKQSYLPFFEELVSIKEAARKIDFENPTLLDEEIAYKLRLQTVKVRTKSKLIKDDRKRIHMLKANLEQDAWNLIKSTCELEEETFLQVEKRRENQEKVRISQLNQERAEELAPYAPFVPMGLDLGRMSDEDYQKVLQGAVLQQKAKEEAERKELERKLEEERVLKLHLLRRDLLMVDWEFVPAENRQDNFGLLSDVAWTEIKKQIAKAKAVKVKKDEEARKAYEKLRKEKEEADKIVVEAKVKADLAAKKAQEALEAEKAKAAAEKAKADAKAKADRDAADKLIQEAKVKAAKEKVLADEKLRKEKEATAKLQAELKAKKDEEIRIAKEEKDKKYREEAEAEAAAVRAAKAPDKQKLSELATRISQIPLPDVQNADAKQTVADVRTLLNKVIHFIDTRIEKL